MKLLTLDEVMLMCQKPENRENKDFVLLANSHRRLEAEYNRVLSILAEVAELSAKGAKKR